MTRRIGLFLSCIVFFVGISCRLHNVSVAKHKDGTKKWPAYRIAACIRDPDCNERFIVAHRGLGFGAPENSREAVRRAVEAGVPIIEIDVRLSKDGELFVLHDSSLGRTTSATGKIGEKTSGELTTACLKNGEQIPTLAEIYDIARGHALLYLDIKGNIVQETADWIAQHGSWDDAIFCVNGESEIAASSRAKRQYPLMIVSAQAYSRKDLMLIKRYFPHFPEIIDIGFPMPQKISWMPNGPKVYVSSLVLEIGLPFLGQIWRWHTNAWNFNLLETNNPLFWMKKISPDHYRGSVLLKK